MLDHVAEIAPSEALLRGIVISIKDERLTALVARLNEIITKLLEDPTWNPDPFTELATNLHTRLSELIAEATKKSN
jgi:hypothetical protein